MKKLFLPLVAFSMLFFSCSKKFTSPLEATGPQISFGSGGGFSGQVNEFVLLSNGQLFEKVAFKEEFVKLPKVKKAQVDQIFETYQTLNFSELSVREPGNMYSFISFKEDKEEHRLVWGNVCPSQELLIYFNNLNALLPSKK